MVSLRQIVPYCCFDGSAGVLGTRPEISASKRKQRQWPNVHTFSWTDMIPMKTDVIIIKRFIGLFLKHNKIYFGCDSDHMNLSILIGVGKSKILLCCALLFGTTEGCKGLALSSSIRSWRRSSLQTASLWPPRCHIHMCSALLSVYSDTSPMK